MHKDCFRFWPFVSDVVKGRHLTGIREGLAAGILSPLAGERQRGGCLREMVYSTDCTDVRARCWNYNDCTTAPSLPSPARGEGDSILVPMILPRKTGEVASEARRRGQCFIERKSPLRLACGEPAPPQAAEHQGAPTMN
jgi:hypothetical protein